MWTLKYKSQLYVQLLFDILFYNSKRQSLLLFVMVRDHL